MPAYGDAFTGVNYIEYEFLNESIEGIANRIQSLEGDVQSALSAAEGRGQRERNEAVEKAIYLVTLLLPGVGDREQLLNLYESEGDWNVIDELDTAIENALDELDAIDAGNLFVDDSSFEDSLTNICAFFNSGDFVYLGPRLDALPYIKQNCGLTRWIQQEGIC